MGTAPIFVCFEVGKKRARTLHGSRQGEERKERIYEKGTDYIEAKRFQQCLTSKRLKVNPKSKNITGLQITDMIAHPSRRDTLIEYRLIEKAKDVFGDKIIRILRNGKYYMRFDKLIGYGLKKLP